MFKKIILLMIIVLFTGCGSTKSKIKTSRSKADIEASKNVKKSEVAKKTTVSNNHTEELESTSRTVVTRGTVADYIDTYKGIAKNNMLEYEIPASIILAQGILESGAGAGRLSRIANNHFGIKCHVEWSGDSVKHDDDALQECFRKYDDPSESYKDHALFLTTRDRYAGLFDLEKGDYEAWAKGLKAAGYATDPTYPDKLISIIRKYRLYNYDQEVLGVSSRATNVPVAETVGTNKKFTAIQRGSASIYEVKKGDTLYSISKKFNTTVENIKKKNNLSGNHISIGQLLNL